MKSFSASPEQQETEALWGMANSQFESYQKGHGVIIGPCYVGEAVLTADTLRPQGWHLEYIDPAERREFRRLPPKEGNPL